MEFYGEDFIMFQVYKTTSWEFINVSIEGLSEANVSTITPIYPSANEDVIGIGLSLKARLVSEYNGTINWYVDDALYDSTVFDDAPINLTVPPHYEYGLVGDVTDGNHTWYANFTDSQNNSWSFDAVPFTTSSGWIAQIKAFTNSLLGTEGDAGMYLLIFIIIVSISGILTYYTKSGQVFITSTIFLSIGFALAGLLPSWIIIVYIVIAGIFLAYFYVKGMGGG